MVVDRVEPEMYGKALPIRSDVVPGEEVVMMFTEPIDCEIPYRFNLTVTVDGLDDLFGEWTERHCLSALLSPRAF